MSLRQVPKTFPAILLFSLLLLAVVPAAIGGPPVPSSDAPGSQRSSHDAGPMESPVSAAVASSITTVVCEPAPVWVGLSTTCTVTVTGNGEATPTGTVKLTASSTNGGAVTIKFPTGSAGFASYFGVVGSSVGTVTITATYSGDENYTGSVGEFTLMVVPIPTKTYVDCSFSTIQVGQSVLCFATVSPAGNGSVTLTQVGLPGIKTPPGSVTLSAGTCTLSNGRCEFYAVGASPGMTKVVGSYSGDSTHAESSGVALFEVLQAKTITNTTCTSQVTVGQSGTCTVVVTASANSTAITGDTVSFTQRSSNGGSVKLASTSCTLSKYPYTCQISFTGVSAGSVTIVANFEGDTYNKPSFSTPTVAVVQQNCEGPRGPATACSPFSAPEFGASPMIVAAIGLVLVLGLRAVSTPFRRWRLGRSLTRSGRDS